MRKFAYIILSLSLIFAPALVYAGLPQAITDYAVSIKNVVKTGVGVTADFAFKKRAANEPEWAAPAKSVSNTKIAGGFIKRLAKFTVGAVGFLVIEKLLEGTDWVMNPENNAIIKPAVDSIFFCVPPVAPSTTPTKCVTTPQAFIAQQFPDGKPASYATVNTDFTFTTITGYDDLSDLIADIKGGSPKTVTLNADYVKTSYGANETVKSVSAGTTGAKAFVTYSDAQDVEITAPELADLLNNATVEDLEKVIQPQEGIDPVQDPAYEDLYADPAAEAEPTEDPDPNPDPNPDPDPEPDPDDKECPTGYIESPNGTCVPKAESSELPAFCSWATPVCDFADWFKQEWAEFTLTLTALKDWFFEEPPSEQDDNTIDTTPVPITPAQVAINFVGSCPAPLTFEYKIYNQTFTIGVPFDPMCEVAIMINPVIKICASIAAIYIVAGIRQGNS